jgi:hypothetical protein
MEEIGKLISLGEYDVYLLVALWMKADHQTIKSFAPEGSLLCNTTVLSII